MAKIHQLSSHMADLIAAGEVVERPASVVKELVENAIDAGASAVTVELQGGGMSFIRVSDNGCGIEAEDVETAFLRHATSKISTAEDLESIDTLGFRGEALAAISAVSRMSVLTRARGAEEGRAVSLEAGKLVSSAPAGCPDGATLVVRDLFYNTPARLKYMKRDSAEGAAAAAAAGRLSLAHPEVSLKLIRDGKEELHTPGDGKLLSAVYAVMGRELAMGMVEIKGEMDGVQVSGYVTAPSCTRGNRNYQHFFVNGRYIKSKLLTAALEEAYKNRLMAGRFPACVVHICVRPQSVDVNVHPAKTEVKFLKERTIFDALYYAVMGALGREPGKPAAPLPQPPAPAAPKGFVPAERQALPETRGPASNYEVCRENVQTVSKSPAYSAQSVENRGVAHISTGFSTELRDGSESDRLPGIVAESRLISYRIDVPPAAAATEDNRADAPAAVEAPSVDEAGETVPEQTGLPIQDAQWRYVGQALDLYIIVETGEGLVLIDKHAAHERIIFERLKAQKNGVMSQSLIMPLTVTLDRREADAVLENIELAESFGFDVSDLGGGSLCLRAVPEDVAQDDAEAALSALAEKLLSGRRADPESVRDELLHTIACKAAVKAGMKTDPREAELLAAQVMEREDIKYCPHGRPVAVTLKKAALEKYFGRI